MKSLTILIEMIDKAERLPTAKDGDAQGNVLALHKIQGYMTMHWSNVVKYGGYITHWGKLPG